MSPVIICSPPVLPSSMHAMCVEGLSRITGDIRLTVSMATVWVLRILPAVVEMLLDADLVIGLDCHLLISLWVDVVRLGHICHNHHMCVA